MSHPLPIFTIGLLARDKDLIYIVPTHPGLETHNCAWIHFLGVQVTLIFYRSWALGKSTVWGAAKMYMPPIGGTNSLVSITHVGTKPSALSRLHMTVGEGDMP